MKVTPPRIRKNIQKIFATDIPQLQADYKTLRSLEKVGNKWGITRERVRQLLKPYGLTRAKKQASQAMKEFLRQKAEDKKRVKRERLAQGCLSCGAPFTIKNPLKSKRRHGNCYLRYVYKTSATRRKQVKAGSMKWRTAHYDKYRLVQKRYYEKNKDHHKARVKKWRLEHMDQFKRVVRKYHMAHRKELNEKRNIWYWKKKYGALWEQKRNQFREKKNMRTTNTLVK